MKFRALVIVKLTLLFLVSAFVYGGSNTVGNKNLHLECNDLKATSPTNQVETFFIEPVGFFANILCS
jgi:hypothetical protein